MFGVSGNYGIRILFFEVIVRSTNLAALETERLRWSSDQGTSKIETKGTKSKHFLTNRRF